MNFQFISKITAWQILSGCVLFLVLVPLGTIFVAWAYSEPAIWSHLSQYVLPKVLQNTLWLVVGNTFFCFLLGVSAAWLTAFCDFPARRFFSWILLLPLAMPGYVLGFVWIGLLDYSGPIATLFREWSWLPFAVPNVRGLGGVVFVMSLALYPYVYLLSRQAFSTQGRSVVESAASLGLSEWQIFWKVTLPTARPWIVSGLLLVMMESMADFGTVAVFNLDTFTVAIYKAWFSMFSITAASQLASILVIIIFFVLISEQWMRGRRGYAFNSHTKVSQKRYALRGWKKIAAPIYLASILLLGIGMPVVQLLVWLMQSFQESWTLDYLGLFFKTVFLAAMAAALIAFVALLLSYAHHRHRDVVMTWISKLNTLGYAVPGTVLAVGVYASLIQIDYAIIETMKLFFNKSPGLVLTSSLCAMMLAYLVRFLRVGYSPLESAMQRMTRNVEEAGRNFGYHGLSLIKDLYIPLVRGGLVTAFLLLFVDVAKEMPITLMTRPFGWDTLAVRIFELTSEGEWQRAALPSLLLVGVGLIPVTMITRRKEFVY